MGLGPVGLGAAARGRLLYGGDYNPEQWPERVWAEDVELMKRAGVNVATVGVFSWATIEPEPGARDFGWLDRVLSLLHANGIAVCLATPTASPPPWLGHRHPETLPVDFDGRRLSYGSRNQFCPSSPVYRKRSLELVTDLAARYAHHPAVVMWHVNNEYCEVCHCDVSAEHFRRWLRARHGTLDALNAAWSTAFWSQRYGDWDEVVPPRRAPYLINPAQRLDFARFSSDALLECFLAEKAVLRAANPDVPITTNFMGLDQPVDYWSLAAHEDVVSHDWYPDPSDPKSHVGTAIAYDLVRSLAGGPWALMEQAASAVSWRHRNPAKPAGQLRAQSAQAVARGADAVCFFQWRASAGGAEKFHSGMLPHAGPDTRVFREVCELGADLARLDEVVGADVRASVAFALDWESWWACRLDAHPAGDFDLLARVRDFYEPLFDLGVAVDFVRPDADLSAYALVVVPNLYLLRDATRFESFVDGGGTLLVGFFSGVVDGNDRVHPGGAPGPLRELLGLTVHEMAPVERELRCESELLGEFTADFWLDDVAPRGAEVVARAGDAPVVLRNGRAWYTATRPEPAATARLLAHLVESAGVPRALPELPSGVEAVRRGGFLFLVNHNEHPVTVIVPGGGVDLLAGAGAGAGSGQGAEAAPADEVELGRFGVAVLRQP